MKILVVDFAASIGGALSVLTDYYDRAKKDKNNEYLFLLSDNYIKETSNIKIKILQKEKKWINRLFFDYIYGRKIVKMYKPDLILSLQNTIIRGCKTRQILYVHQSIPFQKIKKFSFLKKEERKFAVIQYFIGYCIKKSIKKADKVVVQTNWMKNTIVEICKIDSSKIDVIMPTINMPKFKNKVKKTNNKFFYPTSNAIYKNNDIIYKVVNLLNKEGIDNFTFELTIEGESNRCIKKIGRITREEVFKKYSESVLVFPSYIETFGLPLLEAKKSGTIIIASDTKFSHEILDDYNKVYFFNPFNEYELKGILKKIICEKGNL